MKENAESAQSELKLSSGQATATMAPNEREALLARLELAQAAGGIGIHDYDIINDRIEWDARTRAIWGVVDHEPITYKTFASGLCPDDLVATERALSAANDPTGDGKFFAQYRVQSRDGTLRHVEATGQTLFRDSIAVRIVGTVRDITHEVVASEELKRARTFAENLVHTAPTLLYIYDLVEKRNRFIGPQIAPMTGMTAAHYSELASDLLPTIIHPDDLDRVAAHHAAIREGRLQPPFEIEYRLRREDGTWLWLTSTEVVHARDEDGRPTQILGASLDNTKKHEADELRELLIDEMAHRMRNMMGVIQAIGRMTLREKCEPEVWMTFDKRITALVAAQQLLISGDWRSADMEKVVRTVLQPFTDSAQPRISLSGPQMQIEGSQVTTVGLALHELATNAVKYGALSVPGGHVEVIWRVDGDAKRVEWREHGGPPAPKSTRQGFGSMLISSLAGPDPDGGLQYGSSGLVCRLSL